MLIGYVSLCPTDVNAAYLLLELIKRPEYVDIHELKHFLCYELCQKIPTGTYRKYTEKYINVLREDHADDEKCSNATSYLMIPIFYHLYHSKKVDEALGTDLEEKLLNELFAGKTYKPFVQKKLLRFGTLILENIAKEKMDASKKIVVMDIWKKIKSDDPGMKAWAFLGLAKFANKIPMPNERIQEVIYFFLGETHVEYREIVNEAIDSVVPVMYQTAAQQQHEQNLYLLEKTIRINAASLSSLQNVFGMVVRNHKVFKNYKAILYPRMIQAFQKIFFYAKQHHAKSLAFELAKVMYQWSLDPPPDKRVQETEQQIREIVASCLFKELFQLQYILDNEEYLDKDNVELTYKCLSLFKAILQNSPDQNFKFSCWDKHHQPQHNRVIIKK